MKFNANSASPKAATAAAIGTSNSVSPVAVPSVPIPVYRELAAELQATRVMLEALNTKNQQLSQQNQQLRQEVGRVVQLGANLRHWVESAPVEAVAQPERPIASPEATAEASAIAAHLRDSGRDSGLISDELFTEEGFASHQPDPSRSDSKSAKNLNGVWLTLTILVIIATAFGAGFLLMKPFLSNR
jgi:hypothetical protein